MKIGIVGIPNAGKSTLFNALMQEAQAVVANYPFCTIKPNVGKVPIVDERLDQLAEIVNPIRTVPTRIDCVDIAGLISGASKGEGLGNAFLENIRNIDLILHVVRGFKDPDTGAEPTPISDKEIIETELALSDIQRLEKYLEKNKRAKESTLAEEAIKLLDAGKDLSSFEDLSFFRQLGLLTIKPKIMVVNVEETEMDRPCEALPDALVCCAKFEYELSQVPELKTDVTAMDRIIQKAYRALDLITFFTAGKEEVRAWTTRRDAFIPEAAAAIHNDFAEKFIRAEVVSFDEFITHRGWDGARAAGKLRVEGRKYITQDGDVCFFKI